MYSVIQSVKGFFESRSAMSVLNSTSFATSLNISNLLASQQATQSTCPPDPPDINNSAPLLGVHLNMWETSAFVAVQLLQHAPPRKVTSVDHFPGVLEEVIPHKSLLTVYLSGVSADVLLYTFSEMHGIAPATSRVSSVKVAAKLNLPVAQVNLCALVSAAANSCSALPGLVPAQQQLNFSLLLPSKIVQPEFVLCDLLEAGIKDSNLSVAASIVTSKLDTEAVLSWEHIKKGGSDVSLDGHAATRCDSGEGKNNELMVDMSVPLLWSQLAAPQCGLAQLSSGGLDLLIVCEAVCAWEDKVRTLCQSLTALLQSKAQRDKQVLLTMISIAAKSQSLSKPFNPVLCELAAAYRRTVWFSCSQQLWNSLCFFSEVSVPSHGETDTFDAMLVAAMLALVSRLHCLRGQVGGEELFVPQRLTTPVKDLDQTSVGTVGYVSISPSPSDMAMPNKLYGADFDEDMDMSRVFGQVDHKTLVLLRECLLPMFSAAGVSLKQHLMEPSLFKAKLSLEFTLEMREATLFVLDYLPPSSDSSYLHTQSTATTPALFLEQLELRGSMEHSTEQEPGKTPSHQLPLLPGPVVAPPAKVGVLSNCCAAVETVYVVVNAPLLKLAKHISITGKLRRKLRKQAKLNSLDDLLTPRPAATPSVSLSAPPPCTVAAVEVGHVARFASSAVKEISAFEVRFIPPIVVTNTTSNGSSPASHGHIRLVNYADSPRPPKTLITAPNPVSSHSHLVALDNSIVQGETLDRAFHSSSSLSSEGVCHHTNKETITLDMDDGTSPEDLPSTMDTCGEDTTDSLHVISSDNNELRASEELSEHKTHTSSSSPSTVRSAKVPLQDLAQSPAAELYLPQNDLLFSVFGLLKCRQVQCELQVETTKACLELVGISASVDTRNSATPNTVPPVSAPTVPSPDLSLLSEVLPTYLSVAATLKKTLLRVNDRGLPENDLLQLVLLPMYVSIGINNCRPAIPTYRCLLKLTSLNMDIKQSAVKVHKRFEQLMPAFTRIYNDIFGQPEIEVVDESKFDAAATASTQTFSMESVVRLPSKMPLGFIHFSLDKTVVFVAPLPSLTLTYIVSSDMHYILY